MSRRSKVDYAESASSDEIEDFSASEDEWQPNANDASDVDSEEGNDEDFDDDTTAKLSKRSSLKKQKSRPSSSASNSRRSSLKGKTISTLRSRMIKKYNPLPRKISTSPAKPISKDISRILELSKYQPKKSIASSQEEDGDSDSSGDDHLIKLNDLDLKSSFFDIGESSKTTTSKNETEEKVPEFDCNAGVKLSDSEDEMEEVKSNNVSENDEVEDNDRNDDEQKSSSKLIAGINQKSAGQVDFRQLIQYNKQAHEAAEKLKNFKEATFKKDDTLNVSKLLALGEGTNTTRSTIHHSENTQQSKEKVTKKRKKVVADAGSESDTDWEQVQDHSILTQPEIKDVLQINIPLPSRQSDEKKKNARDVELMIKRKLNRDIKEQQCYLHKVGLLCHIAQGSYCNLVLNSPALMSAALKLLPNKTCYPDGKTCIKYFESIVKWYKQAIALRKNQMYLGTFKRSKLGVSLALQIKYKEALCKKDFVLIFIILLRAMGIRCRLVLNLVPPPLKPPQNELHSLSTKAKEEKKSVSKSKTAKVVEGRRKSSDKKLSSLSKREDGPKHTQTQQKKEKIGSQQSLLLDEHGQKQDKKHANVSGNTRESKSKVENKVVAKVEPELKKNEKKASRTKPVPIKKVRLENSNDEMAESKNKSNTQNNDANSDTSEDAPSAPKRAKRALKSDEKHAVKLVGSNSSQQLDTKQSLSQKLAKRSTGRKATSSKNSEQTASDLPKLQAPESVSNGNANNKDMPVLQPNSTKAEIDKSDTTKQLLITSKGTRKKPNSKVNVVDVCADEAVDAAKATLSQKLKPKGESKAASSKTSSKTNIVKKQEGGGSELEHFKEIKNNVEVKRKRASPKPKNPAAPSTSKASAKVESIYFQLPPKRSTRLKKKQEKNENADQLTIPQTDGANDMPGTSKKSRKASNSDDDFVPSPPKKPRPSNVGTSKNMKSTKDRRVLSSSSEDEDKTKKKKMDVWVEVYSEKEEKWVSINLFKSQVNNPDELRKSATAPVAYVFAWNNDNSLKDVSPRYCPLWNTATRKQRVEKEWLNIAISDYLEKRTKRSKAEDVEFLRMHLDKPLPTSIAEYKNHPLYALQRHLLKFEALYPPDALTLGFVRGEAVYSRDCVHTLHNRDTWLRFARVVKPGEKPYKIVKARPKWDKFTNSVITDLPLEIFGKWQTMEYEPPTAENGVVPRNAYGNVDLFKPCMLPKKTVLLNLPGLNRVCKKLKIDCAPAVVGFDFHQGACHPLIDGYVVCEEFRDTVVDAWNREQEAAERKEDEKYYQRVYGNWKKLYRGLLIRERLKKKYNFKTLKIEDVKPKKKKKFK